MFPTRLRTGYQSFLNGRLSRERERYEDLAASGQHPEIMVIGCGDSRVAPETIFDAGPGEIFVIRNIANLVPPCEPDSKTSFHGVSAAIEFAVNALEVKHIVVLGHANCGGISAFVNKEEPLSKPDFIGKWMSQIAPMAERLGPPESHPKWTKKLELAVIDYSLDNLLTFPAVKEAVDQGKLQLHGAYFGVATGLLFIRERKTGRFVAYNEDCAEFPKTT